MKTTPRYRLTAHKFERAADGGILTELFLTKGTATVTAETFDELEIEIRQFGILHAPCNVWVGAASKPKARGFDRWNYGGATKWLFEAPTVADVPRPEPEDDESEGDDVCPWCHTPSMTADGWCKNPDHARNEGSAEPEAYDGDDQFDADRDADPFAKED